MDRLKDTWASVLAVLSRQLSSLPASTFVSTLKAIKGAPEPAILWGRLTKNALECLIENVDRSLGYRLVGEPVEGKGTIKAKTVYGTLDVNDSATVVNEVTLFLAASHRAEGLVLKAQESGQLPAFTCTCRAHIQWRLCWARDLCPASPLRVGVS
jgi:hypothetical protein